MAEAEERAQAWARSARLLAETLRFEQTRAFSRSTSRTEKEPEREGSS